MIQAYLGLKQRFGRQHLVRQPEMDVVMYDKEQDEQFTRDGEEGGLAVLYQLIVDTLLEISPLEGRALDLGCGSAQLLCRIAAELPRMRFTGLDLSANMLGFARHTASSFGLDNVEFVRGSWFDAGELAGPGFDLVTWHLALHHCDRPDDVVRVINGAAEVLNPGGTLFLFDIVRPKTGRLAVQLADLYSMRWGSWFYQDTLDSYKAAFTYDELGSILQSSNLRDYVHVEPRVFNFWQMAFSSTTRNRQAAARSHLGRLWQKRDYFLLKTAFRGTYR